MYIACIALGGGLFRILSHHCVLDGFGSTVMSMKDLRLQATCKQLYFEILVINTAGEVKFCWLVFIVSCVFLIQQRKITWLRVHVGPDVFTTVL